MIYKKIKIKTDSHGYYIRIHENETKSEKSQKSMKDYITYRLGSLTKSEREDLIELNERRG